MTVRATGRSDDRFRWWPDVTVRGAGFPAGGVLRLADSALAARADGMAGSLVRGEATWQRFEAEFAAAALQLTHQIQGIAAGDDFRRAVAWQNHHLIGGAIEPFLRSDPRHTGRNSKHRQREELVALYWQRYCVKNDTIGFFGPVGWARSVPVPGTTFTAGDPLVRSTTVYFETWVLDRLAEVIEADPGIRQWLAPRLPPFVRLVGQTLVLPAGPPIELPASAARVLRACDGRTRARDIAAATAETDPGADVLHLLAEMAGRRWLSWRLDLPVTPFPEQCLRAVLDRVDDAESRVPALRLLERLETGRAAVALATDEPALTAALTALDRTFQEVTGSAPSRNPGQAYGGRTLVYHDSLRDVTLDVGQDLVAAAAPIELLARSGRWLCWRVGETARAALTETYERLVARHRPDGTAGPGVSLAALWFAALRPLRHAVAAEIAAGKAELTRRWSQIIDPEPGVREVRRGYAETLPLVKAAFAVPSPGWDGARYLSPDVMVAAPDIASPGGFRLVVGELHLAINSQRSFCFVTQHPWAARLLAQVDEDFPRPRLLPVPPKSGPVGRSIRTQSALSRERDFMVAFHQHTVPADRHRLVPSAEVVVRPGGRDLVAVLPDGAEFDLVDVFSEALMDMVLSEHSMFADADHAPRVVVDRVVLSRETWRFRVADLPFRAERNEARRFVAARHWRRAAGLPRHVFVKARADEKPVFVDFDSPVLVNILAKIARRMNTGTIGVVEMLPGLEDLWLTDSTGRRYTAELRFTLLDLLDSTIGKSG